MLVTGGVVALARTNHQPRFHAQGSNIMHYPTLHSNGVRDSAVAGFLVASPAWAPWLSDLNEFLTTITLLCGALLGIGRLWLFVRRRMEGSRED